MNKPNARDFEQVDQLLSTILVDADRFAAIGGDSDAAVDVPIDIAKRCRSWSDGDFAAFEEFLAGRYRPVPSRR
jgi:hypothetical protein